MSGRLFSGTCVAVVCIALCASTALWGGGTITTLSTPAGDGQVVVEVDGYGSFGYQTFSGGGGDALYDPVGAVGPSSTSWESAVYFRMAPNSVYLTTGVVGTTLQSGNLADPGFDATTPTSANSSFTYQGLDFDLEQTVEDVFVGPDRVGSVLIQVYGITNPGGAAVSFDLVRYYEGDLFLGLGAGVPDGGGHIFIAGEEFVFETDLAGEPEDTTNLVGITACGGDLPANGRYEVSEWPAFPFRISSDTPLGDVVFNDGIDADEFVDAGEDYDVGIALANEFTIDPGEAALYVTTTVFGTLPPDVASLGCEEVLSELEVCDGVDNDLDGEIDEDLGEISCGEGACSVTVDFCVGGQEQPCESLDPSPEVCDNGIDDDCDGRSDLSDSDCQEPMFVQLESLSARAVKRGVQLRWRTTLEIDNAGFRVLRRPQGQRAASPITRQIIPARGTELTGADYYYHDRAVGLSGIVYYYLEDIDLSGNVTRHGPVIVEIGVRPKIERAPLPGPRPDGKPLARRPAE